MPDFFYNKAGRLRSGWRLAVFTTALLAVSIALILFAQLALAAVLPEGAYRWLLVDSEWALIVQSVLLLFAPSALVAWGCCAVLEDLPWRSLGWALHKGWLRDARSEERRV